MLVKEYGFKSKSGLDELNCTLDSSIILDIISDKDKIIGLLDKPTSDIFQEIEGLDYIRSVSVRHYGVVFDVVQYSLDDREPDEYAKVYFFNNGEIHFVMEALSSYNWLYQERDDNAIEDLDFKMDFQYELLPEKMFIAELYEKTKPKNKKLMEKCKKQIDTLLTNAGKKKLEFETKENIYRKRIMKENGIDDSLYLLSEILPSGFEWCRKAKYDVQVELGCYKIDEEHPLIDGFVKKEFKVDGKTEKYAVKEGFNILEQNSWITSPERPIVITGTVGEKWPVKPSNMSAYDVNIEDISLEPLTVSTKNPKDQEFLVAMMIPRYRQETVVPKWAFREDGTIDESQNMIANSPESKVNHRAGDYIVAKHISGEPEYMELSAEERNTKEVASLYDPRVISGEVMAKTYDHALTRLEIKNKYKKAKKLVK